MVLLTNKKNSPCWTTRWTPTTSMPTTWFWVAWLCGGFVYESLTSTPDAMDAALAQFATERIKLMTTHKALMMRTPI